jgi:hypothetical protein
MLKEVIVSDAALSHLSIAKRRAYAKFIDEYNGDVGEVLRKWPVDIVGLLNGAAAAAGLEDRYEVIYQWIEHQILEQLESRDNEVEDEPKEELPKFPTMYHLSKERQDLIRAWRNEYQRLYAEQGWPFLQHWTDPHADISNELDMFIDKANIIMLKGKLKVDAQKSLREFQAILDEYPDR